MLDESPRGLLNKYDIIFVFVDFCHNLAKWLSYYFILLFFLFLFGLTIQGRSVGKCHMIMLHITVTCQDVTRSCHIMMSYDKCGKVVHRPYSSCISRVQNQMETLSSSPCQLRLGV